MRTQLTRSITLFEPDAVANPGSDPVAPTDGQVRRNDMERTFSALLLSLSVAYAVVNFIPLLPLRYWL